MNIWKEQQFAALDNAVAKFYSIMTESKRKALTDKQVHINLVSFMKENYDVSVSTGWFAKIYYEGTLTIDKAAWITVQAFINMMQNPRITVHALQETRIHI